jgi:GTP-binding protein Era
MTNKSHNQNGENDPPEFRSGFVALIGRPNVGKSTLLNKMVGEVIAITTPKPQTTRKRIRGIVHRDNGQIVFLDTPGIHLVPGGTPSHTKRKEAINTFMVAEAQSALEEVDLVVLLIEAERRGSVPEQREEDRLVMQSISKATCPRLLAVNKIDLTEHKEKLLPVLAAYKETGLFEEMIPISAKTGEGVESLLGAIESRLEVGPPYFPADMITDQPERLLVAEFIRRQVILQAQEEVPYASAVDVISFKDIPQKGLVQIHALIYVEKKSQKVILIGKKGSKIKSIGSKARKDIERFLSCKVFLDLRVKVKANWSRTTGGLRGVGLDS